VTVPREIIAGVYGAWRLARRDPAGMVWFDASPRGFWHSFWGPALVLPGFLILQTIDGAFATQVVEPLVVYLAEGLHRSANYCRFIVAYNWSAVVQMALLLPVALLVQLFPGHGIEVLNLAVTIVLLVYQAYIAHVALAVTPGTAGLLVLLDVLIGALVQMSADHLLT